MLNLVLLLLLLFTEYSIAHTGVCVFVFVICEIKSILLIVSTDTIHLDRSIKLHPYTEI